MKMNERMKKLLSALLCLCMLVQNCPVMAFAAETDNLCAHHAEHTAECGYREGIAGSACNHNHSEDCYKIVACRHTCGDACANGCGHTCTVQSGCITMELDCHHTHGDCGYAEAVEPQECTTCQSVLTHADNCGYVAPVAEVTCACVPDEEGNLVHTDGCGYVAPVEEVKCKCEPTVNHGGEGCTYAEGKVGSPCTHSHGVKVNSTDSCYKLLCSHSGGGHDNACGYVASVSGADCTYHCHICHVQDLVDGEACSGGTATCTEKAVCEKCDVPYGELDKNNHTGTEITYTDNSNGTHSGIYACCNAEYVTNEAHSYGDDNTCICGAVSETISVNITWSEMSFTYTDGEWNPETHTYGDGEWRPDDDGGNVITVTNNGNVAVNVTFTYNETVAEVEGSFTDESGSAIPSPFALAVDEEKKIKLILNGEPSSTFEDTQLGTVTVSITLPEG